jgi:phosphatidylglycerol---prolipoprotein diacylglyceryl transferase
MQQVLFWIPIKTDSFPDGIPIYAYGAMLFCAFVACVWFAGRVAKKRGLAVPREKFQDLGIALFILGLVGARLVFMWQFNVPVSKFFRIWEGGIVLYGGIIGGAVAFILFHHFVLKRFNVTLWQMGDLAAPCVCIGIALGRVGCLLNGCCWGNVACTDCPQLHFPLLTAPSREMVVERDRLQTTTGFVQPAEIPLIGGPRQVIGSIEKDSAAERAGLKEGDRIVRFRVVHEWIQNDAVLMFIAPADRTREITETMSPFGRVEIGEAKEPRQVSVKVFVEKNEQFRPALDAIRWGAPLSTDRFSVMLNDWPRGRNSVQFVVERDGQEIESPAFTPRTVGLHPTQVYEVISMVLLLFLCLAYYPYRRHDGQVWVLFMAVYAVHRFLNEILRTEPVEFGRLTLSQGISIGVFLGAIALEIYLRKILPKRQPVAA